MSEAMPYVKWHGRDWLGDPMLRMVPPEVRGIWIDLLCAMMNADPYGHLAVNGNAMTDDQAARMTGTDIGTYKVILKQIEDAHISSRTQSGILFSRRLVRDYDKYLQASKYGKKGGGNPVLKENKKEEARSQKPEAKDPIEGMLIPTFIGQEDNKPSKKPYGEFKRVMLSDDEHAKLSQTYADRLNEAIEFLDNYLESKGTKYKSHYAVMKKRGWVWEKMQEAANLAPVSMPPGPVAATVTTIDGPLEITQPKVDEWKAACPRCGIIETIAECELRLKEKPKSKRDTMVYLASEMVYWNNKA